MKYLTNINFLI